MAAWGGRSRIFSLAQRLVKELKGSSGRTFSEASSSNGGGSKASTSGRPSPFAEDAASSRFFDNAKPIPQEASHASAATGAAEVQTESSTAGRIAAGVGNALLLGALGTGSFFGYYTYRYSTDQIHTMVEETKKPENSFPGSNAWVGVMAWYADKRANMETQVKMFSDPPTDRLLPDLHPQIRHVQTLVLDLDDLLIHSDWTRARGWRTFKRPGASDLIKHMSTCFELCVYTSQLPTYADPILDRLDPQHLIQYRLYRDSTQYINGQHMRDLSKLNRDLKQVLFVTTEGSSLQPENAVVVKKWKMDAEDTTLLDLIPFLEAVSSARQVDVRDVVLSYEGQDIPTAFRQRIKEAAERQRQQRGKKSFLGGLSGR